jgi:hypothetical protein
MEKGFLSVPILTVSVWRAELAVACIAEAGNDEGVLVQPLVN